VDVLYESNRPFQDFFDLKRFGTGGSHAENRSLPRPLAADFGDRDIEFIAQPLLNRTNHTALLFERLRSMHVDFNKRCTDDHAKAPNWLQTSAFTAASNKC
jgi:hypothetical protein